MRKIKILVCTDGSVESQKALAETPKILKRYNPDEVAILHVYELKPPFFYSTSDSIETFAKAEDIDIPSLTNEKLQEEGKKVLSEAIEIFAKENIKARTIMEQGSPSETITNVALKEGFDMIVVCSRGRGGLRRLFRNIKKVGSRSTGSMFTVIPAIFIERG